MVLISIRLKFSNFKNIQIKLAYNDYQSYIVLLLFKIAHSQSKQNENFVKLQK